MTESDKSIDDKILDNFYKQSADKIIQHLETVRVLPKSETAAQTHLTPRCINAISIRVRRLFVFWLGSIKNSNYCY
jgi:hypothetical protein